MPAPVTVATIIGEAFPRMRGKLPERRVRGKEERLAAILQEAE
jgi:hypothetical protein